MINQVREVFNTTEDQLQHQVFMNIWDQAQEQVHSKFSSKLWREIYFSDIVWEKVRYCMLVWDELEKDLDIGSL
jgi:hypothetical protein